jgi:hypothetical protein
MNLFDKPFSGNFNDGANQTSVSNKSSCHDAGPWKISRGHVMRVAQDQAFFRNQKKQQTD